MHIKKWLNFIRHKSTQPVLKRSRFFFYNLATLEVIEKEVAEQSASINSEIIINSSSSSVKKTNIYILERQNRRNLLSDEKQLLFFGVLLLLPVRRASRINFTCEYWIGSAATPRKCIRDWLILFCYFDTTNMIQI